MAAQARDEGDIAGEVGVMVHVIQKGNTQVRISVSDFKGQEYIDIRTFYLPKEGDGLDYKPTRRGVTIPTDSYWDLLKGVVELGNTLGLLDPEAVSDLGLHLSQGDEGAAPGAVTPSE